MGSENLLKNKRFLQATILVIVVITAIMAISPARALVLSFTTSIAGFGFEVTDDYPGDNYTEEEEIIQPQVMSLDEALAVFPYSIELLSDMPAGYTLMEDSVRVYVGEEAGPFANTLELTLQSNTSGSFLHLRITDNDAGEIVAPEAIEEILLDDTHTAALIQGGWDADQKVWRYNLGLRLRWSVENLYYDLYDPLGTEPQPLVEFARSTFK